MKLGVKILVFGALLAGACAMLWKGYEVALASTCSLKVWNPGDTLLSSDLNSNFSCLNSNITGPHGSGPGGLIIDQDVAAAAAIQYTKLNRPTQFSQAWAALTAVCNSNGACASVGSRATVARTATGIYTVTLGYTAVDAAYGVVLSAFNTGNPAGISNCVANTLTITGFSVTCGQLQIPGSTAQGTALQEGAADLPFAFAVYDDEAN